MDERAILNEKPILGERARNYKNPGIRERATLDEQSTDYKRLRGGQMGKRKIERIHSTQVVSVSLKDIRFFENPRIHPEREIEELVISIEHYGFTVPVLLSKRDNTLVAGYARLEAYKRLGKTAIPAIHLDIEPNEYAAYAIVDNRIAELASWDYALLIERIEELQKSGGAMVIAYTPEEIDELRHWQEEASAALDMEDLVDKKEAEQEGGPEMVEILIVLPFSMWERRRTEIESEFATLSLKFDGMRVTSPKVKVQRKK